MTKKDKELPTSLAEVAAGHIKGSLEGMKRLLSPHPSVRHVLEVIERLRARPYATSAVIGGEPGTGKEGLAHTLHELMHPEGAPLCSVSTAGRDDAELSAELFGRAPAHKGERPTDGAVHMADGGTLILDEVVGLSPRLQRRLLEVLKRGAFQRAGEERVRRTQLNIVAITDGNLLGEVTAGRFRHDLYHKLARLEVILPPLRERPEDIPAAITWMAERLLVERDRQAEVILEDGKKDGTVGEGRVVIRASALEALRRHRWPGNFRELEVIIERALLLYSDGKQVTAEDVAHALADPRG